MTRYFENALVYLEGEGLKKTSVQFGERILSFQSGGMPIALPENAVVLPGFLDGHIHGAGGADVMDGTQESLSVLAQTIAAEGTTSFLATTMTQSEDDILHALCAVKAYCASDRKEGARLLGVHLEGPFISASFKGAQNERHVQSPDCKLFESFQNASGGAIKMVTLAPEQAGALPLIERLSAEGVIVSIGHTAAGHEEIARSVRAGASSITHTYNAQSALHHRQIGAVGCALLFDELSCELICDCNHVSIPAMKLLVKCKPKEKLRLVTDALRAKGLGDGESELGGQKVFVHGNEARLADGTLAGSVLRMNRAVQNLVEKVGVPFLQAVDCASINPAKTLGLEKEIGSIALGKRADFAVLDRENYNVLLTVRDGVVVYSGGN